MHPGKPEAALALAAALTTLRAHCRQLCKGEREVLHSPVMEARATNENRPDSECTIGT